jgi:REP element-mobilizing transposase RayT
VFGLDGPQGRGYRFWREGKIWTTTATLRSRFDTGPSLFRHLLHPPAKAVSGARRGSCSIRPFAERAGRDFNIGVGRYVIMPDHVHLFVRGGEDFRLGRWVGLLKQALAKASNLPRAKTQLWQEGFFDHVLRSDESYSQKWNYVRENPMRAGLIKSAEEWPYQGEIVYIDRA